MLKKTAETIVSGAFGLIALYVVGKIAYQAGKEVAREECRFRALQKENDQRVMRATSQAIEDSSAGDMEVKPEAAMVPVDAPTHIQRKKKNKLPLLFGAGRILGNKRSVIGHLMRSPEDHKFEAFVEGDELQIHVRRKEDDS